MAGLDLLHNYKKQPFATNFKLKPSRHCLQVRCQHLLVTAVCIPPYCEFKQIAILYYSIKPYSRKHGNSAGHQGTGFRDGGR